MKLIDTKDAVGHVLCHDITQIIPGERKGPVFKKGHVVTAEDIPVLLSVGKEHLYVWEMREDMLHEDEAAGILKDICTGEDPCFSCSDPSEGKIEIFAATDGLLKIDTERLDKVNSLGEMMIATIHGNFPVKKGDKLAGTRIIPLVIKKEKMEIARQVSEDGQLMRILPFRKVKYGLVITGNEVASGRIEDAFGPVLTAKMSEYGAECIEKVILPDDRERITEAILAQVNKGADMVLVSGGMSVDPDDKTPGAIKDTVADIVSYGAPVLPGAMFLLSYLNETTPVMGLPGCIMYARRTVFDLVLPRILAGEKLTAADLSKYGEGGLCLSCDVCRFPNCGFGK
ncbi:MAG: molybdopterin-binding protein [Lachnospiraceae bacterium]|nr:molybdopterin-binding protein [Lachnospiraceae bacterium]